MKRLPFREAFFRLYLQQTILFMKKLFPLIPLLFSFVLTAQDSYIGGFSEGAGLSDSRLLDAVADFTSKMRNKMVLASNIKGSPYFEEGFQKGRLDYFGRDVKGDAFFRYNAYNDEIELGIMLSKRMRKRLLFKVRRSFATSMGRSLCISLLRIKT